MIAFVDAFDKVEGGPGCYTQFGYHSARAADREGRTPPIHAGAAPVHDRLDRERLVAQSRAFLRNNGLYRGIGRAFRQLVHGDGFVANVRPADSEAPNADAVKTWCEDVEAKWSAWWGGKPDVRGRLSGRRVGQLVADELFACGDTGVVLVQEGEKLSLQVVESEQIRGVGGPQLIDGITMDAFGRATAYSVAPYDGRSGALKIAEAKSYAPEQFLLIGMQDRASSTRAVPPLQASFPNLHRLEDIANSEAIAWQLQAKVAILINRQGGPQVPNAGNRIDPHATSPHSADGELAQNSRVTDLDYGLIFHGRPGETVTGMDRTAPGGRFPESFAALARLLGLPVGMPLELVLFDWTHNNYSQTRAVIAIAADAFNEWQLLIEEEFYARVFAWWLAAQITSGAIAKAPGGYVVEWIKPAFPWIDLLAETKAWGERISRGLVSWSLAVKSQNLNPEAVLAAKVRDRINAIKAAQQVKTETGVDVDWQGFCGELAPVVTLRASENLAADAPSPGEEPPNPADAPPAPAPGDAPKKPAAPPQKAAA